MTQKITDAMLAAWREHATSSDTITLIDEIERLRQVLRGVDTDVIATAVARMNGELGGMSVPVVEAVIRAVGHVVLGDEFDVTDKEMIG